MRKCLIPKVVITTRFYFTVAAMLLLLPLEWVLGWFLAVLVHEFGHLITLLILRIGINSIVLDHNGVFMRADSMNPLQEALCALAGPLCGLCLILFARQFPHAAVCALIQTCFNLIPLYPLDGGRVIHGVSQAFFEPSTAMRFNQSIEIIICIILSVSMVIVAVKYHLFSLLILAVVIWLIRKKPEKYLAKKVY